MRIRANDDGEDAEKRTMVTEEITTQEMKNIKAVDGINKSNA